MKRNYYPLVCIVIVFIIYGCNSNKEFKHIGLHDPFSFDTAKEMYAIADTLPYSSEADLIINRITIDISNGMLIEYSGGAAWANLQMLEPYRMNPKIQAAVKEWIEKMIEKRLKMNDDQGISMEMLKQISTSYKNKDFSQVIEECLKGLLSSPKSPDLRNNLALALIHQNKDLCAQIELEILLKLYDSYVPGIINLMVVYERMNRSHDAEVLAERLQKLQQDNKINIPEAHFNRAWLKNKRGDYEESEAIMSELFDFIMSELLDLWSSYSTKYTSLEALNQKQLEQKINLKPMASEADKITGRINNR